MSLSENPICPVCGGTAHEWGNVEVEHEDSVGEYARVQKKRTPLYFGIPFTQIVMKNRMLGKPARTRIPSVHKTPIQARRCKTCGFLAFFANPPVEDDEVDDTEDSRL